MQLAAHVLQNVASYTPRLKTTERQSGCDSSREALSLCCHPSVKHTVLSSSPDSGATQSDTHSLRNTALLLSPPPSIAATHEISPARPSRLRPFVTTNKVVFSRSLQHAAHFPHPPIYLLYLCFCLMFISHRVNNSHVHKHSFCNVNLFIVLK